MSYDIRLCVKVEGLDHYVVIDRPEYDSPTYNLGEMFVTCMGWDYEQGIYYKCSDIIENIERGVNELQFHMGKYKKYNPENGWGDTFSALDCLRSVLECIRENEKEIPLEYLYFRW